MVIQLFQASLLLLLDPHVVAGKQHVVGMDIVTRYKYRKEENIKRRGKNNM